MYSCGEDDRCEQRKLHNERIETYLYNIWDFPKKKNKKKIQISTTNVNRYQLLTTFK